MRWARSPVMVVAVVATSLAGSFVRPATVGAQDSGPPRPVSWMAAGDSFASGEGTTDPEEPCQRGSNAWAMVAQRAHLPDDSYEEPVFVACTGAHLDHLRGTQADRLGRSQVDQAHDEHDGRFDLVTFSFGGNDVDFGGAIKDCVGAEWRDATDWGLVLAGRTVAGRPGGGFVYQLSVGCDITEEEMKTRIDDKVEGDLAAELNYLAEEIVAPGGQVLVVGYPHLIEDAQAWPAWHRRSGRCSGVRASDVPRLRGATGYMNETLKTVTEAANHESVAFAFVDVNGQVFETDGGRHGLCSETPWLNDVIDAVLAGRLDRAFHPNDAGHAAMGKHVASRIGGLDWTGLAPVPSQASLPPDPAPTDESIVRFHRAGIGPITFGDPEPSALDFLLATFGDADSDSGWSAHQCTGVGEERTLTWDGFGLMAYLSRDDTSDPASLASWTLRRSEGGDHIQVEHALFNKTWADLQQLGATYDEFYEVFILGEYELLGQLSESPPVAESTAEFVGAGTTYYFVGC